VILVGIGFIGAVGWFVFFFTHHGDVAPPIGVVVDNRMAIPLNIYLVVPGQRPVIVATIPADSRVATGMTCGMTEMVAKDPTGRAVPHRRPYPTCDETDWVIVGLSSASASVGRQ
jgi:hypothetical protein